MVYSDTTNKNGIVQLAEWGLGFPDGTISGDSYNLAIFTSIANTVQYDILIATMRHIDGWDIDDSNYTDFAISTTPLLIDQRDYKFPTNLLKIKRMDISYDATSVDDANATWYRANPIDSKEMGDGLGNDAKTDARFTKTDPRYDPKNGSFDIYPRSTDGVGFIRIEFDRTIDPFLVSSTTKEPGIDVTFHDLLVTGIKLKWAVAQDMEKAKSLKTLYDEKMVELGLYYADKIPDEALAIAGNTECDEYR